MSYYVTNENSFLDIKNAHLRVTGNVHTDVLKVGSIGFQPAGSNISGTVNFTNVTTGVTTTSNLDVGGTLNLGTIELSASTHTLDHITARGNVTSTTVQFDNATTGLVTTSNVEVGGELTVNGTVDLLSVSNVASIKKDSNVVTEFPRSKKLIRYPRVALTAASGESSGYQGYYVTESSNAANDLDRTSWKAFNMTFSNADPDDTWTTDEGTNYNGTGNTYNPSADSPVKNLGTGAVDGEWIKLQLPQKIKLEYMKIWLKDNDPQRIPEDWKLYGSDDNTNWTELFSKTGQIARHENTYNVNATSMYNYLAVVVTKISVQQNYFRIVELEYFGVPEYDPEAHGTDVVVKSVPNVPNTDWLEVYYDAKGLTPGAVGSSISGLGGTTNNGTAYGNTQISGGAFVFDGNGDYIETTVTTETGAGNWPHSYSFWMKADTDASSGAHFVALGTEGGAGSGTSVIRFSNDDVLWYFWSNDVYFKSPNLRGRWVHIVGTYDGGSVATSRKIFINNVEAPISSTSGTISSLNLTTTSTPFKIGSKLDNTSTFKGSIANVRLFNRALTTDEIYQLYAYQKEYFGHGDLSMTLKDGRLGIGTSEPKATLDIRGEVLINGYQLTSMYPGFATGGDDVYDIDGYRIHVFTTSGTFVVPGKDIVTDILLVGGGGGGGQDNAGGGGAGGLIFKPGHTFEGRNESNGRDGAYTIVIGSGGAGSTYQNSDAPDPGGDTYMRPFNWKTQSDYYNSTSITRGTFTNIFTAKGGGPGNNGGSAGASTLNGGSGGGQDAEVRTGNGGGVATQPTQSGDSGTYGYGNNGGNSADQAGGGGGGAGKVGESAGSGATLGLYYGGYGGDGLSGVPGYDFAEIFGTKYGEVVGEDVYFAGGGAGANRNTPNGSFTSANGYALGGKGGGGSAGGSPETNEHGLPGTGGGGAGATWVTSPTYYTNLHGGNGGSGIVMIRYRL